MLITYCQESYEFLFSYSLCVNPHQVAAYDALMKYESEVKGRARYGVRAFADAILVIPKTLGKLIHLNLYLFIYLFYFILFYFILFYFILFIYLFFLLLLLFFLFFPLLHLV